VEDLMGARWSRWLVLAALALTGLLTAIGLVVGAPRPIHAGPDWPSFGHLLGLDASGRDFLGVLSAGAVDFTLPGIAAGLVLVVLLGGQGLLALRRPAVGDRADRAPSGVVLAGAAAPRLLVVMVAMLLLEEPSPWVAAGVVTALHAPIAIDEIARVLARLRDQEILAGTIAHGLARSRIAGRHLLLGHLREPVLRHAAALFSEVAFTQVALSYLFGASAVTGGLGVSWGMEFRRLAAGLPGHGLRCPVDGPCPELIALFHAGALLLVSLVLFGGLVRAAHRPGRAS
jgi:ABC-type dipeptide/oligopeptide/nickel transport system permease subunit